MINPNASLPALGGKVEQIVELCRQFHVKRLEIFGSTASGAFRPESSDLDFVVDFGDQSLGPWGGLFVDFADALDQFDHGYEKVIAQLLKMIDQASLCIIKPHEP